MSRTFSLVVVVVFSCSGPSSNPDAGTGGGSGGSKATGGGSAGSTAGGNGATGGGSGAASVDSACAGLASAQCAKLVSCGYTALFNSTYASMSDCVTATKRRCVVELGAAGSSATPATLERCASAVAQGSCGLTGSETCLTAPGTRADGAACAFDSQCASGKCGTGLTGCGTCRTLAAIGATCDGLVTVCPANALCQNRVCVEKTAHLGDSCASAECLEGFCVAGTCTQLGSPGSSCDSTHPCNVFAGVSCNAGTCTSGTTSATMCTFGSDSAPAVTLCQAGLQCNLVTGACSSTAAQGQSCDDTPCATGLTCIHPSSTSTTGGLCQLFDGTTCG